jgi:hypothetical protein
LPHQLVSGSAPVVFERALRHASYGSVRVVDATTGGTLRKHPMVVDLPL